MSQRRLHYPTQGIGIALPTSVRVIPDPKTIIGLRQSMHCLNNALRRTALSTAIRARFGGPHGTEGKP